LENQPVSIEEIRQETLSEQLLGTLSAKLVANQMADISETSRQTDQTWKREQRQLVTSLNFPATNLTTH
jgi:hypothetical protein